MEYQFAAYTDMGLIKRTNQDSLCVRRSSFGEIGEGILAVVCDGLGGLEKGEVASAAAITAMERWYDERLPDLPSLCTKDFSDVRQEWLQLLRDLHKQLADYAAKANVQMGTTLTAILTMGDRYLTANIGDSRIYERYRSLRQLTQDQSLVAQEVASGHITEEQARTHPQRNVLLQCLGMGEEAVPVFTEGRVQGGALYLLCSDGFVHALSSSEMEERLDILHLVTREDMNETLRMIVEECKHRGEQDNITAVLFQAKESPCNTNSESVLRRFINRLQQKPEGKTEPVEAVLLETAQIIHTQESILENDSFETH